MAGGDDAAAASLVCMICGNGNDNSNDNSHDGTLCQCSVCRTVFHAECYGLDPQPYRENMSRTTSTTTTITQVVCVPCASMGDTIKVRQRDASGKRLEFRVPPAAELECCLCGHANNPTSTQDSNKNKNIRYPMHPLYDAPGPTGRHMVLPANHNNNKEELRLAWVHSVCGFFICNYAPTLGCVYGNCRDGRFFEAANTGATGIGTTVTETLGGKTTVANINSNSNATIGAHAGGIGGLNSANSDTNDNDDDSVNSYLDEDRDSHDIHHFVMPTVEMQQRNKQNSSHNTDPTDDDDWLEEILYHQTNHTCCYCGRNDRNSRRMAIMCCAHTPEESPRHRALHQSAQEEEACTVCFHVGCALYGSPRDQKKKKKHPPFPDRKRIFFYPPQQQNQNQQNALVCEAYCDRHARDIDEPHRMHRNLTSFPVAKQRQEQHMVQDLTADDDDDEDGEIQEVGGARSPSAPSPPQQQLPTATKEASKIDSFQKAIETLVPLVLADLQKNLKVRPKSRPVTEILEHVRDKWLEKWKKKTTGVAAKDFERFWENVQVEMRDSLDRKLLKDTLEEFIAKNTTRTKIPKELQSICRDLIRKISGRVDANYGSDVVKYRSAEDQRARVSQHWQTWKKEWGLESSKRHGLSPMQSKVVWGAVKMAMTDVYDISFNKRPSSTDPNVNKNGSSPPSVVPQEREKVARRSPTTEQLPTPSAPLPLANDSPSPPPDNSSVAANNKNDVTPDCRTAVPEAITTGSPSTNTSNSAVVQQPIIIDWSHLVVGNPKFDPSQLYFDEWETMKEINDST